GSSNQYYLHGIHLDVKAKGALLRQIPDPPVIKALFPDLTSKDSFLLRPVRKTAFDELQRSLQSDNRSKQQMKMVWHDYKFMQQIFALCTIVEQDFHQ